MSCFNIIPAIEYNKIASNRINGIGDLNPFEIKHEIINVADKINSTIDENYKEFVMSNKPYIYFITLTFALNTNIRQACKYMSTVIKWMNNKLFGRKYYDRDDFIEGFAFIEDHKSGISINDIHAHILIKPSYRYNDFKFYQIEDMLRKTVAKVDNGAGKKVFNENCIDIQLVRDDGAIEYCFKQVWRNNTIRIKMIGKEGVSDDL